MRRALSTSSLLILVCALLGGCSDDAPTSVLLEIRAATGLPTPDALRLDIYGGDGRQLEGRRVPEQGAPSLPGQVVLYPPQSDGRLVVVGQAFVADKIVGEGGVQLALKPNAQLTATLELEPGRLPDADADGVPDIADRCPGQPDPPQGPCDGADGGGDGPSDGGVDVGDGPRPDGPAGDDAASEGRLPDGRADTTPDLPLAPDGPAPCTTNGSPCDDGDPCTQGEVCQGGSCVAPPLSVEIVKALDISFRGHRTIVVDSKGVLHAVLYAWQSGTLHHASKASPTATWQLTTIDSGQDVGAYPALAIDSADTLYAFYQVGDGAGSTMYLATKPASGPWTRSAVAPGDGHAAIAVEGSTIHLAYQASYDLVYQALPKVGPAPAPTKVWGGNVTSQAVQIALAVGGGKVHIAFGVGIFGSALWLPYELRYAVNSGSGWTTEAPWSGAGVSHGIDPSIAIDAGGQPWISFGAGGLGAQSGLYLAKAKGSGGWSVIRLDSGRVGSYSTLFIAQSGEAQIVYRDYASDRLLFGSGSNSASWKSTVLDSTGEAGRWASATRAPGGRMHVVYEDSLNDIVRHASFSACP